MKSCWSSATNALNTNFYLYGSYSDFIKRTNPWNFCNYDDCANTVAFPRDCSPSTATPYQWTYLMGQGNVQQNVAYQVLVGTGAVPTPFTPAPAQPPPPPTSCGSWASFNTPSCSPTLLAAYDFTAATTGSTGSLPDLSGNGLTMTLTNPSVSSPTSGIPLFSTSGTTAAFGANMTAGASIEALYSIGSFPTGGFPQNIFSMYVVTNPPGGTSGPISPTLQMGVGIPVINNMNNVWFGALGTSVWNVNTYYHMVYTLGPVNSVSGAYQPFLVYVNGALWCSYNMCTNGAICSISPNVWYAQPFLVTPANPVYLAVGSGPSASLAFARLYSGVLSPATVSSLYGALFTYQTGNPYGLVFPPSSPPSPPSPPPPSPSPGTSWLPGVPPAAAGVAYRWGNYSAYNPCVAPPGGSLTLPELVAGSAPLVAGGARCDSYTTSLRSWGGTPAGASPDAATAAPISINGAAGATLLLWFQLSCVLLGAGTANFAPYRDCAASAPASAALAAPPTLTLSYVSSVSMAAALSVTLAASAVTLPFAAYGAQPPSLTVSAAWAGCVATGVAPTLPGPDSLLAVTAGPQGGVSIFLAGSFLSLSTNGHATCYGGAPFLHAETGTLVLNKTNAIFTTLLGTPYYADWFGFDDLQVTAAALPLSVPPAMFAAFYAAAASPPPSGATGGVWTGFAACAAQLAHRYAANATSFAALPGLVSDLGPAGGGGWTAQRLNNASLISPGAAGAAAGALVVQVPAPAAASELAAASGLTLRVLFDGGMPELDWMGFSSWTPAAGGLAVSNAYTGRSASALGAGTLRQPVSPAASGAYTTLTLGPAGARVYLGAWLWAAFPRVAFAAGAQGNSTAANRITVPAGGTLYDLQVYNYEMPPSTVVALASGVALSN
jgi:hypothetical protein